MEHQEPMHEPEDTFQPRAPDRETKTNLEHSREHPALGSPDLPATEHGRTVTMENRWRQPPGGEVASTAGQKSGGGGGGASDQGSHAL